MVGVGAITLVKGLQGPVEAQFARKEKGAVEIEIDGKSIEVDEIVARVSVDVGVRAAMERVVAEPFASDGINAVKISPIDNLERIEKPDESPFDRRSTVKRAPTNTDIALHPPSCRFIQTR